MALPRQKELPPLAVPQRTRASQKDLFGLSRPMMISEATGVPEILARLAREGIRAHLQGHNHWILRGQGALPEIHCYSERELRNMACSDARFHLTLNQGK